jgi:hypothetical protein
VIGPIEDIRMSSDRILPRLTLFLTGIVSIQCGLARGESPTPRDTLVIRLVHPDRQAATVLKLFDGATVPHPAAALAGWKRAARDPNRLGKPLEAVIAMFNPEMAPEWKVLDDAELRLDLSAADGKPRWFAVVPRDDGSLSAAITAQRVTSGALDLPLTDKGQAFTVQRLGPAGALLASQVGDSLVFGSSPDELLRGLRRIVVVAGATESGTDHHPQRQGGSTGAGSEGRFDSGLIFDLAPGRMNEEVGAIFERRAVALLRGLGCSRIRGSVGLNRDLLALEMTTTLEDEGRTKPVSAAPQVVVDRSWLSWIPADGVMGFVSMAFEPGPAFLESMFAVADRVERADPARAGVASLRSRLNLLAAAAGARPEVDLWPHLRGVTACVMCDADRQGRPGGALVVLHTDGDPGAVRLATDVLPRLGSLLTGKKPGTQPPPGAPAGALSPLGTVGGRPLSIMRHGRDVVIAWGEPVLDAAREAMANPDRSAAPLCTGWLRSGKRSPQRVGAIWPARCWPGSHGPEATTPAWRVLAEAPPAVWWGWTEPNEAVDSIHYADLRPLVHDFLEKLPLDPSPLR